MWLLAAFATHPLAGQAFPLQLVACLIPFCLLPNHDVPQYAREKARQTLIAETSSSASHHVVDERLRKSYQSRHMLANSSYTLSSVHAYRAVCMDCLPKTVRYIYT
ncbi:hypothetical protein BJV82DRAFT_618714 [Fennellomyces sp. T-0311]|nr:hypothetical protein BJV82DRAFT_618714 [Fennellomyces sp. T-0311]